MSTHTGTSVISDFKLNADLFHKVCVNAVQLILGY